MFYSNASFKLEKNDSLEKVSVIEESPEKKIWFLSGRLKETPVLQSLWNCYSAQSQHVPIYQANILTGQKMSRPLVPDRFRRVANR